MLSRNEIKECLIRIDQSLATLNANGQALMTIAEIRINLNTLYEQIGDDQNADKLCEGKLAESAID